MENSTGIYLITNKSNNKKYVGSAKNIIQRWKRHKYLLNKNTHYNLKLQNAWNKYGENTFEFEIFEFDIPFEDLLAWEQAAFEYFKPEYNICQFAGNTMGKLNSPEVRIKISLANTRRIINDETRHKLSIANIGRKHSSETISKMINWQKNNKNPNLGKILSSEIKMKMRAGQPKTNWTHCQKGHIFNETNTVIRKNGRRKCRLCSNEYQNNRNKRLKLS